jgi:DNA-binding NarL/FixJ family response regulator
MAGSAKRALASNRALIGRDVVLAQIVGLLAEDQAVLLVGEGGIGKSTLLQAAVEADGRPVHWGGGLETMRWRDYLAVGRAIGDLELVGDVEAVASRVEAHVGPDLLVVDDIHLADEASLLVLAALAGRVAVIAAARPGGDDVSGFTVLEVEPLDDEAVGQVARAVAPEIDDARLQSLIVRAGGIPLLVEEFAAAKPNEVLLRGSLPRLEGLSEAVATEALRLALAGRPVTAGPDSAALIRAGIATDLTDGTVRIRHALLGDAVIRGSDADAIADAHRVLALQCEDAGEAARHWLAGGDDEAALRSALAAAEVASTPGERASHLSIAARAAHAGGVGFLLDAAEELAAAGRYADVVDAMASIDAAGGDMTPRDQARCDLVRARAHSHAAEADEASVCARRGLAIAVDVDDALAAALAVEVVRGEAGADGVRDDHDALLRDAEQRALRAGRGRAAVLNAEGILCYLRADLAAAAGYFARGRVAAADEGDVDTEMRCANNEIVWHESGGDRDQGLALASQMADRAGALGLGEWQAQFQAAAANLLLQAGDYPACLRMLDAVDAAVVDLLTRDQARTTRIAALVDLGLLTEAERLIALWWSDAQEEDWLQARLERFIAGSSAFWSGRPAEALTLFAPLGADNPDRLLAAMVVPLDAWARRDLGLPPVPVPTDEVPDTYLGFLTEAAGVALLDADPAKAAAVLDFAAAQLSGRWYSPSMRSRWGAAEARRLADDPTAVAALLAVEEEAMRTGLAALLTRVRRSLRLAGVVRAAPRALDRSGLVTERERQVLDLVAQGQSLAEIARRLGVGRPTVRRVLSNARSRLGADSRIAAASTVTGSGAATEQAVRVVASVSDVAAAVLDAAQGQAVLASVADGDPLFDVLYSDLRRLGSGEVRRAPADSMLPPLPAECEELLVLLAAGQSLGSAASQLHISRRTADHRVAQARDLLGVRTTVEAVVAYRDNVSRDV